MSQAPDTDLNEHVRRAYGNKESALLIDKMRHGIVVPKLTHEECLELLWQILADPALHKRASQGFKKVGQSVERWGKEDQEIVREAGKYWNEPTSDGCANMREKINRELTAVADAKESGEITWSQYHVKRLILSLIHI